MWLSIVSPRVGMPIRDCSEVLKREQSRQCVTLYKSKSASLMWPCVPVHVILQFRGFCCCAGRCCGGGGPFGFAGLRGLPCLDWGGSDRRLSIAWTGGPWNLFTIRARSLWLPWRGRLDRRCGGRDFRRHQKIAVQMQSWELRACF